MPLIGTLFNFPHRILPGAVLALMTTATLVAQIPQFEWVVRFGATNNELVRALDTDANGNIYAVGEFSGTVDFDPGPGTVDLTSPNTGGFIVKLDPAGALLWALSLNASVNTFAINDISVDPAGNAWVIGTFAGTMDIDPGPGVTMITSSGGADVFFLRLDPDGTLMRHGRGGGSEDDTGNSIVSDDQGNAYMTGRVRQGAVFQSGSYSDGAVISGFNEPDVFVLKLPPSGDFAWYQNVGGFFWDEGNAITLDPLGNVLVTGTMSAPSDFGQSNPYILTGDGTKDVFVYKLSNDGDLIWANAVGPGQEDIARDIATDLAGNVYTTGTFYSTVDFDPGAGETTLDAAGGRKAFVQRLNTDGIFQWASTLVSDNNNWSSAICVNSNNRVFTTGYYQQTTDFDPGPGSAVLPFPSPSPHVFLQEVNSDPFFEWAGAYGGSGWDQGFALACNMDGSVYMGGFFEQSADFHPGEEVVELTAAGGRDAFIVKMGPGINLSIADAGSTQGVHLWPNPGQGDFRIDLRSLATHGTVEVTLFDAQGRCVAGPLRAAPTPSGLVDLNPGTSLAPGLYNVQVQVGAERLSARLVVE